MSGATNREYYFIYFVVCSFLSNLLIRITSIITVEIITSPPKVVFKLGDSLKKIKPKIIPYIGCNELIKLAVVGEKYFKL